MKIFKTTIAALLLSFSLLANDATLTVTSEGSGYRVKPNVTVDAGQTIKSYKIVISYDGSFQSADGFTVISNENNLLTLQTVSWWSPSTYTAIMFSNTSVEPVINGTYATLTTGEEIFIGETGGTGGGTEVSIPGDYWLKNGNNLITDNATTPGNVGIGIDSPTEKLHVEGNVLSDGLVFKGELAPNYPGELGIKPLFFTGSATDYVGFDFQYNNTSIASINQLGEYVGKGLKMKGWLSPTIKGNLSIVPSFYTGSGTDFTNFIGFEFKSGASTLAYLTNQGRLHLNGDLNAEGEIASGKDITSKGDFILNAIETGTNGSTLTKFGTISATTGGGVVAPRMTVKFDNYDDSKLQLFHNGVTIGNTLTNDGSALQVYQYGGSNPETVLTLKARSFGSVENSKQSYFIRAVDELAGDKETFIVRGDGAVGIQTQLEDIPEGYSLAVNGKVICTELDVQLSIDWPDYVFADDYELMPIDEVASFISKNNHLPNIPSASEIEKNGVPVAKMEAQLLRKVEELTLYIIEMEKRMNELEASK